MATSSLTAWRLGCVFLLAATMLRCGLSADGQGALPRSDAGGPPGSSSGGSSGYGSSGAQGASSSGLVASSSGTFADTDADSLDGEALDAFVLPTFDGAVPDAPIRIDAGRSDANAGSFCSHLTTCCNWLALYGASSGTMCLQYASSGDETTCASYLGLVQSVGLCLGA